MFLKKGYTPNWGVEIFTIERRQKTNPATYILKDSQGQLIKGGFYEPELQKTKHPDVYLVEKVLRTDGDRQLIKWLGFDNSHNSWINNDYYYKKKANIFRLFGKINIQISLKVLVSYFVLSR